MLFHLKYKQVQKFTQQQKTLVATMRRFSAMKKESSITRDIKLRAESIHRRLGALSKQIQKTEEQHGPTAAPTRIQLSQHAALSRKFKQVGNILCSGFLKQRFFSIHFFSGVRFFSETLICLVKDSLDNYVSIRIMTLLPEPEGGSTKLISSLHDYLSAKVSSNCVVQTNIFWCITSGVKRVKEPNINYAYA